MGVQAGKELSTIVLEACEAAEQAGEQQLDEFFSDVVCPIISAGSLSQTNFVRRDVDAPVQTERYKIDAGAQLLRERGWETDWALQAHISLLRRKQEARSLEWY